MAAPDSVHSTLISNPTPASAGYLVKRSLDLTVAALALLALAPILALIALGVKLDSPGGVLYVDKRIGRQGRTFNCYKFRTMVANADQLLAHLAHKNERDGILFKIANDPRITRFGRRLRKHSLDELPQLYNVIRGDMSLVGPRPMAVRDYEGFNEDWQRRRFSVRPGITCLWQVLGRNCIPFEQWMELDLQYIDRWSLWLDFQILAKTIPAVLKGSGAS